MVLGGVAVPYERGTPVTRRRWDDDVLLLLVAGEDNLRTTTLQKYAAVMRRARIQGS